MIKPKWEEREYLGIEDMLKETVNMNSRDKKTISNMAAMAFFSYFTKFQVSGKFVYRYINKNTG